MEVPTKDSVPITISRVEAVVNSIDQDFVELQIVGSYETFQWPRNMLNGNASPTIGQKILLELKNHPLTAIQKVVENAKNSEQHKLLESLIN